MTQQKNGPTNDEEDLKTVETNAGPDARPGGIADQETPGQDDKGQDNKDHKDDD